MADNDKPNKSGKPVNSMSGSHIEGMFESRQQDIESMGFRSDVGRSRERVDRLEEHLKTLTPNTPAYTAKQENIGFAYGDLENQEAIAARAINNQYAGMIATRTDERNINRRTTTMSGQHQFYGATKGSPELYRASEEIESSIANRMENINARGSVLAGRMRGLGTGDVPESLQQEASWLQQEEGKVAYEKRLLKVQNKAGLSTEKLFGGSEDAMGRTDRYLKGKDIQNKVSSGNVGSIGEETQSLGFKQQSVFLAQQQYDKGVGEGAGVKEMQEFAKALKESTDALSEQQQIVEEMNSQGVGRGGPGKGMAMARTAFGIAGVAANAASTIGLDYELEQTQLRTNAANIANRQYQQTDAMLGGDMSAMLELTQGDKFKKLYADRMGTRANMLKGAEATAGGLDAAASATVAGAEVAALHNIDVGGGHNKLIESAGQTAGVTKQGFRLGMGLESGGYGIKAAMAGQDLATAMNAIPADQMQMYFDVNRGGFDQGVGLGAGRGGFMKDMTGAGNMEMFKSAGLSPKQAMQAAGMAVPNVGVTEDYSDLAFRAGKAQQRGILGVGDYMKNVGQLADVGGGSGNLEGIMSKAITAGMENAKNINQMVSATSKLAARSAAMGISTAGSSGDMLAASIQSMRSMGVNENIATGAAANALDAANQGFGQMGTLADLQFRANAKSIYGAGWGQAEDVAMRQFSQEQMKEIQDETEEGKRLVEQSGMGKDLGYGPDGFESDAAKGKFGRLRRAAVRKEVIEQLGPSAAFSDPNAVDQEVDSRLGLLKQNELTDDTKKRVFGQTGILAGATKRGDAKETRYYDPTVKGQGMFPARPEESTNVTAFQLQDITEAGRGVDKYKGGEEKFDKLGGIAGLVEIMEIARDAADPKHMEEAVKKAATELKVPADIFSKSTTKFDGAVTAFVAGIKEMGVSVPEVAEDNTKKVPRVGNYGADMSDFKKKGGR